MNKLTKVLPDNFDIFVENLLKEVETVEGYLSPNEIRFLALMGACPTAEGEVLEIGSFKGKSTIILAKSSQLAGNSIIHAVDPMTAPSETDPDLAGQESSLADFQKNITDHRVADRIEFHQTFSGELAKTWNKKLRLLWIDGDHTYRGTKLDLDSFYPHLVDNAIVAIHDVLHEFEGGIRVFAENILLSPNFGKCGFWGSIGWAQFHSDPNKSEPFHAEKIALYKKASRLIPFVVFKNELKGFTKKRYKLFRGLVPRKPMQPRDWLDSVR